MNLAQHVPAAARQWAHQPRLAAIAVLTLALGIGGATTMYGFLQAFSRFGRPTVPQAEEVGRLFTPPVREPEGRGLTSLADFHRWQQTARSFEALAAYASEPRLMRTTDGGDEVEVLSVTPAYFALLRTPPVIGRFFNEQEGRSSGSGVAILGEQAWRERFQADPKALGRTLELEGRVFTIIGVTSYRLGLVGSPATVYLPFDATSERSAAMVIGRRRSTVTWDQVRAELAAVGVSDAKAQLRARVVPILEDAGFRTRVGWMIFVGPAVVVLLIGCANVASLLLVRAAQREREVATRLALGASRRQLAAQFLAEGWVLAGVGGAIGALLSHFGLRGLRAVVPANLDVQLELDAGTLLFAGIATLATPLVFGVAPLLHSLRVDLRGALSAGLHRPLFGVGRYHVRDLFAVFEVGLSLALVAFTFMLLSFFNALRSPDLAFDASGLLVAQVRRAVGQDQEGAAVSAADVERRLRERVLAVPGVSAVTFGDPPTEGAPVRLGRFSSGSEVAALQLPIDRDYFATLRLPIKRGRAPSEAETRDAAAVAVLNEGAAARLWPSADAVGQVLYVTRDGKTEPVTIVGVSQDAVRLGRLGALDVYPLGFRYSLYRPRPQGTAVDLRVIARVQGQPASLYQSLQGALQSADPRLRLRKVVTMAAATDPTGGETPLPVYLLGGFGCLALLLAVVGVFGVMSQLVDERRRELGVRAALGASSRQIVALVVRDGLIRVGLGSGAGLLGLALTVRTGFAGLISATAPDPTLWLAVLAAVTLAAACACYWPARRAAALDPIEVLRCE